MSTGFLTADTEEHPLAGVCSVWCALAKKAQTSAWAAFGRVAHECWKYYDEDHSISSSFPGSQHRDQSEALGAEAVDGFSTSFKIRPNKAAELVQLFGPSLYFQNPQRQVTPRIPEVPGLMAQQQQQQAQQMVQQQYPGLPPDQQQQALQQAVAQLQQQQQMQVQSKRDTCSLLETYLNYTPNQLGLREESRMAIEEALVKGRGVLWTSLYQPPDSNVLMPRSEFDSVDNLLLDPDAEKLEDAAWCMRICTAPYWIVEDKFGLERGQLKKAAKSGESTGTQANIESSPKANEALYARNRGDTQDLVTYFEIWSKCGMGQYLKAAPSRLGALADMDDMRDTLDRFGRYCYLAVVDGVPWPLNLPPQVMELEIHPDQPEGPGNMQAIEDAVKWPIPFYLCAGINGWPFTELDFHPLPRSVWPMSHLKPALAELKFLRWATSFLAGHVRVTSRVFIAWMKGLDEEVKKAIETGPDMTILELPAFPGTKNINELVQFLQHPSMIPDLERVVEMVENNFNKRTGLLDLMYGETQSAMRSAEEAQVKQSQTNIRPADMAECVEAWQSRIAAKEALATRLFIGPQYVAAFFGEAFDPDRMQIGPFTKLWMQLVYRPAQDAETASQVAREFDYRIEAGSLAKPNHQRDLSNINQAIQTFFPDIYAKYQQDGDPTQVNWLFQKWAKAAGFDVPSEGLFPQAPPPAPPQPAQQGQPQQKAA